MTRRVRRLGALAGSAGATVLFLGTVRDRSSGFHTVDRLEHRADDRLADRVLHDVAGDAARWAGSEGLA